MVLPLSAAHMNNSPLRKAVQHPEAVRCHSCLERAFMPPFSTLGFCLASTCAGLLHAVIVCGSCTCCHSVWVLHMLSYCAGLAHAVILFGSCAYCHTVQVLCILTHYLRVVCASALLYLERAVSLMPPTISASFTLSTSSSA
jgi:hypothetical protein